MHQATARRPHAVEQQAIQGCAALHLGGPLVYHEIRVRRESVMEECHKT
jgi:hypothetical protein